MPSRGASPHDSFHALLAEPRACTISRLLDPEDASRLTRDRGLSPDGQWLVHTKNIEGVNGLYLREQSSGTERLLDRGTPQHDIPTASCCV